MGCPTQQLSTGVVKQGPLISLESKNIMRPDGFPRRPASVLPPPGDQHLTLSLGERLGRGRVGSVHAVNIVGSDLGLPSLVVKICRPKRLTSIAQEAWFYEELEQLQGICVPRCYGFFQARLHEGDSVLAWIDEDEDKDKDGYSDENGTEDENENENETGPQDEDEKQIKPDFDYPFQDEDEAEDDLDFPIQYYDIEKLRATEKEYENQVPGEGIILSILLLERLGGNIPLGEPVDSIRDDVYELFNDLSRLGIEILDIRWSNILAVNDNAETDLSGTICPNHGHAHRWRIIDFDRCRKTDAIESFTDRCNYNWLNRIFSNVVWGCIVEPWEI